MFPAPLDRVSLTVMLGVPNRVVVTSAVSQLLIGVAMCRLFEGL